MSGRRRSGAVRSCRRSCRSRPWRTLRTGVDLRPDGLSGPEASDTLHGWRTRRRWVTGAGSHRPDRPALPGTRVAASAERAHNRGNGTRATPARSSHDFAIADTAARCCSRTRSVTPDESATWGWRRDRPRWRPIGTDPRLKRSRSRRGSFACSGRRHVTTKPWSTSVATPTPPLRLRTRRSRPSRSSSVSTIAAWPPCSRSRAEASGSRDENSIAAASGSGRSG